MAMRKTQNIVIEKENLPIFKTVELVSRISGIGENKLRELMKSGRLDYLQIGSKCLLTEAAILQWYEREKTAALYQQEG